MAAEQFANSAQTTLLSPVTEWDTSISVVDATAFPDVPQFRVRIGDELMLVTAVAGTAWTVDRPIEGTQKAPHSAGATVTQVLTAGAMGNLLPDQNGNAGKVLTTNGTTASWAAGAQVPTGTVLDFAAETAPSGYLACDGSAVNRTTYATLFGVIGTTWGEGDGSTTFNVPDLQGRTAIGSGTGPGLTPRTLGGAGGDETHQLTTTEMPSHTHPPAVTSFFCRTAGGALQVNTVPGSNTYTHQSATGGAGGDGAHNNMQPFRVTNKIIKT